MVERHKINIPISKGRNWKEQGDRSQASSNPRKANLLDLKAFELIITQMNYFYLYLCIKVFSSREIQPKTLMQTEFQLKIILTSIQTD